MVRLATSDTYLHTIEQELLRSPLWDYLKYDDAGDLWINSLRIRDVVSLYGSPLEIHDMTIMKKRADWWRGLVAHIASDVGYTGSFSFYYASKANMSLPYVSNAYKYGWFAETSSVQDLLHLKKMHKAGLISQQIPIICNGFKFQTHSLQSEEIKSTITFQDPGYECESLPDHYAQEIVSFHDQGFSILPILDSGELDYFSRAVSEGEMSVGLRLKFGLVRDDEHMSRSVSRHGMEWNELVDQAHRIQQHKHLKLKMLHLMVSAAEITPVDDLVESLLYGAEKYFELKLLHPELSQLNIGGGIPPVSSGYDYELFLSRLLSGLIRLGKKFNCDLPEIVFEFGSFLAEECGFYVHRMLQRKHNSLTDTPGLLQWAIIDGGLMAELPDMFITNKKFVVLAGNHAHEKGGEFVLGDLSCDSDGRYPRKKSSDHAIVLPDVEDLLLVFANVGAYQKMLSGAGGAHHCGILNAAQVVIEEVEGEIQARYIPRQTSEEYAAQLGYEIVRPQTKPIHKPWWSFAK